MSSNTDSDWIVDIVMDDPFFFQKGLLSSKSDVIFGRH